MIPKDKTNLFKCYKVSSITYFITQRIESKVIRNDIDRMETSIERNHSKSIQTYFQKKCCGTL